jgi:hypothetical protein
MFCGNCGTKTVEGHRFCVTCGRAQRPASGLTSVSGPVLEEPRTPAEESIALKPVEGAPPMEVTARTGVSATQPGQEPLYCTHRRYRRTMIGVDREHGSEICLGCKLPYSPGSPNSRTEGVAQERNCNVASGEKPVRRLPKVLVPIAAVALAFALAVGVGWAYGVSHRQGQQGSGDAQAAACARVATLNSQINDLVNQYRQLVMSGSGGGPFGEQAALEREKTPLEAELVVQNKVCKG